MIGILETTAINWFFLEFVRTVSTRLLLLNAQITMPIQVKR